MCDFQFALREQTNKSRFRAISNDFHLSPTNLREQNEVTVLTEEQVAGLEPAQRCCAATNWWGIRAATLMIYNWWQQEEEFNNKQWTDMNYVTVQYMDASIRILCSYTRTCKNSLMPRTDTTSLHLAVQCMKLKTAIRGWLVICCCHFRF